MRRVLLAPALALALALLAPAALAALPGTPIVAQPGAWVANYATPVAAVPVGGALTFANADVFKHDVVSHAFGADDQPWCVGREPGRCPLFWTPLVGTGGSVVVQGLDRLAATQTYTFYCTLHAPMEGTLVALPAAG